ncbi:polysaccharide deacetylase family protein [Alteribacillus bidgolensis]|uniref:Polysaccharide deacetylase n=1 Tax=Alteribacillus bidgolensis TaxID=930129 RepID=A0A1G8CRL9_9BACI|nr:polysaccharide deacetylase family protein [Alteribacillus bidgolensis]SDH48177.1 Polysaccharide deacetylase [Alteribacillus bidgolensis]
MYDFKDERWIKNIEQLRQKDNKVILTFDDGPSRKLEAILDVLKEKQVQAVFFWNSRLLYPQRPWQRVVQEGHKIGSHAHNHKNLTTLTKSEQYKQIKTSVEKIQEMTGLDVQWFRPPFGQYNEETMEILRELCLTPVMWEISSYDWENKSSPEVIVTNVVEHIQEGSIILLHELKQTLKVLPDLIDQIREKGFEFALL